MDAEPRVFRMVPRRPMQRFRLRRGPATIATHVHSSDVKRFRQNPRLVTQSAVWQTLNPIENLGRRQDLAAPPVLLTVGLR